MAKTIHIHILLYKKKHTTFKSLHCFLFIFFQLYYYFLVWKRRNWRRLKPTFAYQPLHVLLRNYRSLITNPSAEEKGYLISLTLSNSSGGLLTLCSMLTANVPLHAGGMPGVHKQSCNLHFQMRSNGYISQDILFGLPLDRKQEGQRLELSHVQMLYQTYQGCLCNTLHFNIKTLVWIKPECSL